MPGFPDTAGQALTAPTTLLKGDLFMNSADQLACEGVVRQRLVLTIDVPETPANEKLAIDALLTLVRHFEFDAIYPTYMALEFGQAPTGR